MSEPAKSNTAKPETVKPEAATPETAAPAATAPAGATIDPKKTRLVRELKHDRGVLTCRFTGDGRRIFAGAQDEFVHRWNLGDLPLADPAVLAKAAPKPKSKTPAPAIPESPPVPKSTLAAHDSWIQALALSADGKVLFRATGVGEVHAFEVASGNYRTAFAGHKANVLALDTPTDVRRLVSGSLDTTALLWNVGFGGKKGEALSADERAKQWEVLTDPDGAKAYAAMVNLAADPDGFIAMAKAELKPAGVGPTAKDLAPIFRDLDGKTFAIREAASAKLDKYGEGAVALARARLEVDLSAEVRYRLKRFLEKCDGPGSLPTRLRQARAVELLEHLGTADAKVLLEKLAKGGASYMTTDSASALKRIEQR